MPQQVAQRRRTWLAMEVSDGLGEGVAFDETHGAERSMLGVEHLVDRHDSGVLQLVRHLGFQQEDRYDSGAATPLSDPPP